MDRRDFIKIAGSATAGAAIASCAGAPSKNTTASPVEDVLNDPSAKMLQNYPGISTLGYGCMRWKMTKDENGKDIIDQASVDELVDYAMAHGVNFFDSAPVYLQGQSEAATGKALQRYPRDSYYISTKLSNHRSGLRGYEAGVAMFKHSLECYGTDHIDYYLLHNISGMAAFKERFLDNGLMDFVLEERKKGHIKNLGFSFHGPDSGFDELLSLHEKYHWDFVMIQMNYMDWSSFAQYEYEELAKRDIPVMIMEPLLGGRLSSVPASISDMLKAREPQKSIASWAFRFCGSFPKVLTVLSGMTYMEHLQDNLRSFLNFDRLESEELAFLEEVAQTMKKFPLVPCTACQYCMPCPYGIDIPGIFKFWNKSVNDGTYITSSEQKGYERMKKKYLLAYNKAIETVRQADHCIGCNLCVEHCPQRIRIPREIIRIDKYIDDLKQGKF